MRPPYFASEWIAFFFSLGKKSTACTCLLEVRLSGPLAAHQKILKGRCLSELAAAVAVAVGLAMALERGLLRYPQEDRSAFAAVRRMAARGSLQGAVASGAGRATVANRQYQ